MSFKDSIKSHLIFYRFTMLMLILIYFRGTKEWVLESNPLQSQQREVQKEPQIKCWCHCLEHNNPKNLTSGSLQLN